MGGEADGQASASQVVGGNWSRPKGPSPDDDRLVEDWKTQGKLHLLEGVWCCVPYKVMVVPGAELGSGEASRGKAQKILDDVADLAKSIFSHFEKESEVSTINKLEVGEVHVPSPAMRYVLDAAARLNRLTRGAFDPAILPLADHYRKGGAFNEQIAKSSKWSRFRLDEQGIAKTSYYAKLDLCGLAKGWAIDEMAKQLSEAGFESCYVDWGGDIKVGGQHPAGRNWTVAVVEPIPEEDIGKEVLDARVDRQYLAHVELKDGQSIATSGDYRQTLAKGLSHILDSRNGRVIKMDGNSCASVSVVSSSCMLADALATAAMSVSGAGVREGRKLLDGFRGSGLKDPVLDYLLYSRAGPRVVRLREPGTESKEHRDQRYEGHDSAHVVVVGGGLAGVSAAIEASKAKARVTIIEKEQELGGNSAKATSGINACNTRVQKCGGVDDDSRYFERDTHVSARGGQSDLGCVSTLSGKSADAVHWLIDELGIPLTVLTQLGGHARKRTHRVPPRSDGTPVPVGFTIMQHARAAASAYEGIDIKVGCTMTEFVQAPTEDGTTEIGGIRYRDSLGAVHELVCDAVIITTGGFGYDFSDNGLMAQHRPDLVGVPTTNGSFANGDGIRLGNDVGANLVDMDKVQLHPTAFIDPKDPANHTKYLGPEALRGSGGILLDQQGRRFVNELDLRSVVSKRILEHCDAYMLPDGQEYRPWSWCVLNEEAQEKFGRPMLNFYKNQVGLFEQVSGTKGLAELVGCPEENIIETLREYAVAVDQKVCPKTGKVVFPTRMCESDSCFIVARITPGIHYCMGGLEISAVGEVQTRELSGAVGKRRHIRRLFAAGECTGGVHGGNRLGGNSLLECVVFGRLAGERAATINQKSSTLLDKGDWVPVTLREIRATDVKYGHNTAIYRFNLHGSLQTTGLEVGRFVAIRGELDGDTLTGYYSPISRPDDEGVIDILCRTDEKGGPIVQLLASMTPGSSCSMRGMGGPKLVFEPDVAWQYNGRDIRKLSLLCGGTGLAPAVQIARAYIKSLRRLSSPCTGGIKIVYAAECAGDLAFVAAFDKLKARYPGLLEYYLVLNSPPAGWTQGIGFVDDECIRNNCWFPPENDHLLVMCGPPIFENIMCNKLASLGYPADQFYSFADDPDALS